MKKINQKDINKTFATFNTVNEDDILKLIENKDKIEKIASNDKLHKYLDYVKLYMMMLKDIFTGKYKKIPVGTLAAIVGTLVYVINPIDLISDFIPIVGYLDDAAILGLCINLTRYDVEKYKKFKAQEETKLIDKD